METTSLRLLPEALRRVCDPAGFDFETTADLPQLEEIIGQPRAVGALEFGAPSTAPSPTGWRAMPRF